MIATPGGAGVNRWTPVGPVTFPPVELTEHPADPSLLFARSESYRTLYRSQDAGKTWHAITWIADVSLANGTLYGLGGWPISTDGGYTLDEVWVRCPQPEVNVRPIAGDARDARFVFGVDEYTGRTKIFRSLDGGCAWSRVDLPFDEEPSGVFFDSDTVTTIYSFSSRAIVRSTDLGATWQTIGPPLPNPAASGISSVTGVVQFGSTLIASMRDAGVLRTDDGGATWLASNQGHPADRLIGGIVKGPGASPVLYAHLYDKRGDVQLYRSDDGGRSWISTGPPGVGVLLASRHHPDRLYGAKSIALGLPNRAISGGLVISDDGGRTWVPASLANGLPNGRISRVHVDPVYGGWIHTVGGIRTLDRGATWTTATEPLPGASGGDVWGSQARAGVLYASRRTADFRNVRLFRSVDFGETWSSLDSFDAFASLFEEVTAIAEGPASPATIYVFGQRREAAGQFLKPVPAMLASDDGGVSWTLRFRGSPAIGFFIPAALFALAVAPSDAATLYAGGSDWGIYGTNDGGMSWTRRDGGLPEGSTAVSIAVSATDPSVVYASMQDQSTQVGAFGLYRSTDGGATWVRRGGNLPAEFVTTIAVDPHNPNVVYVGLTYSYEDWPWSASGLGVFRSADGGATFSAMSAGLPAGGALRVNQLVVDPTDSRTLYAATNGGLYTITQSNYAVADHAIEYYEPTFDHYFVTTEALAETVPLDGSQIPEWSRTGRSFPVYRTGAPGSVPVCRFFSGASFAPKSSHFYTPYDFECDLLVHGDVWQYEGDVFGLKLPVGPPGAATCPPPSVPLYRAYNNGRRGAPNHRYTDDLAVLEQMIAQGWTFEGHAQTKVFACIPGPP